MNDRTRLPLPDCKGVYFDGYSAQKMREYSDAENAALRERIKVLERLVIDASYTLNKARIWGGMGWTYNPLHPVHYAPMLERLRNEYDKINDEKTAMAARKAAL